MKDRIGEYLVIEGKITAEQLVTTLERQLIMGGRLGTNLLELGLISEGNLLELLSKKFNLPPASADDLDNLNPSLTEVISREVAEKYKVVPFKRDRNTIHIAFLNPLDLNAITELGFITGCVIKPHIAVEARLLLAMERYYKISRALRYISLLDDERKRHESEDGETPKKKDPSPEDLHTVLEEAKGNWAVAQNRDDAIVAFLKALHLPFDRGVLFLVKSGKVFGWRSFPVALEPKIKKLQFDLDRNPTLNNVLSAQSHYQGKPPPDPIFRALADGLSGPHPNQISLVPLVIKGNVVAILYGDNQASDFSPHSLEFVLTASRKVSLALEILILKNKILND